MGGDLQLFQQSRGLGSVTETVSPELDAEPRVLARRSDPETSHRAAENAAMRSGSHKALLLIAYGYADPAGGIAYSQKKSAELLLQPDPLQQAV